MLWRMPTRWLCLTKRPQGNMIRRHSFGYLILLFFILRQDVHGENWPGWRGPRGDGSSREQEVPLHWDGDSGDNIAWKVTTNGVGHASPIVWGNRVFLCGCDLNTKERVLTCFDRRTGKVRWHRTVFQAELESIHGLNSYASGTPATDGKFVFTAFLEPDGRMVPAPNVGAPREITTGRIVVACYGMEGHEVWKVSPGEFVSAHGFSSCPVLFEDLMILNGDHDGESYVIALDKRTGEERWRVARRHKTRSYVTPLIREINGQTQMMMSGSMCIISLDPRTGQRLWNIEGPTEQFVASMVYDGNLAFMVCGFPDHFVMGLRPDGRGDVTRTHVAWESTSARSYVPSPVVLNGYLLVADDRGTANCFDATNGEPLWKGRLGSGFNPSLIHANGLVYFVANDGQVKIVRPGKSLQVVAENKLGDLVTASPAISQGQLFIRSHTKLFCIGEKGHEP